MFARVSNYQGSPDQLDEGIRRVREQTLPQAADLDGYKGAYFLASTARAASLPL
jgi:hypothetical protein